MKVLSLSISGQARIVMPIESGFCATRSRRLCLRVCLLAAAGHTFHGCSSKRRSSNMTARSEINFRPWIPENWTYESET